MLAPGRRAAKVVRTAVEACQIDFEVLYVLAFHTRCLQERRELGEARVRGGDCGRHPARVPGSRWLERHASGTRTMLSDGVFQQLGSGSASSRSAAASVSSDDCVSLVQFGKFVRLGAVLPTTMLQIWAYGCYAA